MSVSVCRQARSRQSNVLLSQFSSLFVSRRLLLNLELTGLARSRDPPVSASPVRRIQHAPPHLGFYLGAGGPHSCTCDYKATT